MQDDQVEEDQVVEVTPDYIRTEDSLSVWTPAPQPKVTKVERRVKRIYRLVTFTTTPPPTYVIDVDHQENSELRAVNPLQCQTLKAIDCLELGSTMRKTFQTMSHTTLVNRM